MRTFNLRGKEVSTSSRKNVNEHEDPETGIVYALFNSADAFIREVVGMYDEGIQGIIDDDDAHLFIYYTDGHCWSSIDGTKKGYYRSHIYSAVYDNGWFGEYAFNADLETIDMGDGETALRFEPRDPKKVE